MPLSRRTILLGLGTWSAVGLHAWLTRREAARSGPRLVSWNLRNYSGATTARSAHAPGHDLERLAEHLARLDADVFCFQEVTEPEALGRVLPGYVLEASALGGAHRQHLVIARRPHVRAGPAHTDDCTALHPGLRPVLTQTVQLGGQAWSLAVVHLKAGPAGYDVRRVQRRALLQRLAQLGKPRMVVGDFNTTGSRRGGMDAEIASLAADFETVGLHRTTGVIPCTAYWEGGRFDRFKQPSTLDHVFADGAGAGAPALRLAPGAHCARLDCGPLSSSAAYPDLDYERVSDHCPMVVDVLGFRQVRDP